ncbi:IS66 family insertion sequence element accessory protein TnpB, partial [Psychrobacter piechaudii]|uniref:IS66 family insertion sequence element accessory protein TnpB n=1 Tax=Psychrobacter piechaudii TaxID=1945521 RepID=UPI00117A6F6C
MTYYGDCNDTHHSHLAIPTPMDMRCGSGKLLAHILTEHQSIRPHCAYLFYNKAGTRLKVFIHDGLGVWLC